MPLATELGKTLADGAKAVDLCVLNTPSTAKAALTVEEKHAVEQYSANSSVNRYLRDPGLRVPEGPAEQIALIQSALTKAPELEKPIKVWRGLSGNFTEDFVVGNEIQMAGFQSATFDANMVPKFAITRYSTVFEITTRQGLEVVGLREAESEFLLGHNWRYRVTGKKISVFKGEKRHVVELEVVGQ